MKIRKKIFDWMRKLPDEQKKRKLKQLNGKKSTKPINMLTYPTMNWTTFRNPRKQENCCNIFLSEKNLSIWTKQLVKITILRYGKKYDKIKIWWSNSLYTRRRTENIIKTKILITERKSIVNKCCTPLKNNPRACKKFHKILSPTQKYPKS